MPEAARLPLWDNLFRRQDGWQEKATRMLAETPIFAPLPKKTLRQLVGAMHLRRYESGEKVFSVGEPGLGMYLVLTGNIEIQLHNKTLAELAPGDFFGEVALFGDEVRTATAVAVGSAELVGFFRPDLEEWLERSPRIGARLLLQLGHVLAQRLRKTNQRLMEAEG